MDFLRSRFRVSIIGCALVAGLGTGCQPIEPSALLKTRNLFADLLGKTDAEIDAKLAAAWGHFFHGSPEDERLYFPVADDMAYVLDVGNGDVRSEGMSYGMMIAVQLGHREEFDRLWKWADTHMRQRSGERAGFFAWQCAPDGTQLDPGPASDGEEWFATALFMASRRWGNGVGIFDYEEQANEILEAMVRPREGTRFVSMWDVEAKIIRFVPERKWAEVTDPSYHLPAFYELWADRARERNEFWAEAARTSRRFFRAAAHPRTGLMADYTDFEGRPFVFNGHEDFRFDAWRTLANVAVDYDWWKRDRWAVEQSNRVLTFLATFEGEIPNQMRVDGTPLSDTSSSGLYHMAAVAGLAADENLARPFVQRLWDAPFESGQWRYYDGLLHLLALLQVSGRFEAR
jgi:oligosaccharide reducing-end xylanase